MYQWHYYDVTTDEGMMLKWIGSEVIASDLSFNFPTGKMDEFAILVHLIT